MDKFVKFLEEKVMPIAFKISQQKNMRAIRTGIVATLPLTIVGSFFVIFMNIPIPGYEDFISPYRAVLDIPFRYTVGILSLYASYGMGAALARSYDLDEVGSGLLALLAFLVSTVVPIQVAKPVEGIIGAGRYINIGNLSSGSLFGAIVTSMVAVEIYRYMKQKNITIKMPEGVPQEVSNSFAALLPTVVVILLFWVLRYFLNFDISATLSSLMAPLKGILAGNSLFGGMLTVFLITGFWSLGIHGPAIMGPVIRPIWDISIAENMQAFASGTSATQLPNIFTEQFLQWFIWIGGAGATMALVVLFIFSKSKYLRSLGRLSFLPGLFNINEPIIFGAPIVMNPILAIPFILAPMIMTIVSYFLTVSGIIPMMMARLPFTMPAPLAAIMSTNWNIFAGILVLINFLIALAVYYPFFKVFEKQQLQKEAEAGEGTI